MLFASPQTSRLRPNSPGPIRGFQIYAVVEEYYLVIVRSEMSTEISHILFRAIVTATKWLTSGLAEPASRASASESCFLVSLNLGPTDDASLRSRESTAPTASLYMAFTDVPIFSSNPCSSFGMVTPHWVFSAIVTE